MRIPRWLAWFLVLGTAFTAGLLRQYHDRTPVSPWMTPAVGSLLFAAIFFLLLVSAWERRRGAVPGRGVRLGSVTPLLLILLIEKWVSLGFYNPLFSWLTGEHGPPALLDAQFRALAGVGLIAVCLVVGRLSVPTARKTWRRARPARWPEAAALTLVVVAGSYAILAALAAALGGGLRLSWPDPSPLLWWVLGGQAVLAFAEEVYYRGLVMTETERLAPRLGAVRPAARRWTALLVAAGVFAMEHARPGSSPDVTLRNVVFTASLALLFGLLVMVTANLHFAAGIHAWINWLLLGAAPYLVGADGEPALPAGTYVGVALVLAFVVALGARRLRHRPVALPGSP